MHSLLPETHRDCPVFFNKGCEPLCLSRCFQGSLLLKCLRAVYIFKTSDIESFLLEMGHGLPMLREDPPQSQLRTAAGTAVGLLEAESFS